MQLEYKLRHNRHDTDVIVRADDSKGGDIQRFSIHIKGERVTDDDRHDIAMAVAYALDKQAILNMDNPKQEGQFLIAGGTSPDRFEKAVERVMKAMHAERTNPETSVAHARRASARSPLVDAVDDIVNRALTRDDNHIAIEAQYYLKDEIMKGIKRLLSKSQGPDLP